MSVGYSGTPLVKKLGIKPGHRVLTIGEPDDYWDLVGELPEGAGPADTGDARLDFVHFFATTVRQAVAGFETGQARMASNGMIWASWPKKASGVVSELDEDRLRGLGLERGLVDVKVCAVDATWSGLKFVIPLKDRG